MQRENKQPLTFVLKLKVAKWQVAPLLATIRAVNDASNSLSRFAFANRFFTRTALSKRQYMALRNQGLPSSLVLATVKRVSDVYANRHHRKGARPFFFTPLRAIDYNRRGCKITQNMVRIRVLDGWLSIPFECSPKIPPGWEKKWNEARLVYHKREFRLVIVVPVDCPPSISPTGVLGVDVGMANLAVDSDGEFYVANHGITVLKKKYDKRIKKLQAIAREKKEQGKRPRSVYRKIKILSSKEQRAISNLLRCVAKRLVMKALGTNRAIAIENPQGICKRRQKRGETAVRHQSRHQANYWPCINFLSRVQYKARLAGVPVMVVSPHSTSTTCPYCGTASPQNRKTRDLFLCRSCGYSGPSDFVAAINISQRGEMALRRPG